MSPQHRPVARFPSTPFVAPRRSEHVRGFTLIELMVVVVIISVISALATPGILRRVDSYKTRSAAEQIASTFRLARLRAMGRGSAVVVRYQGGTVTVLEGVQGPDSSATGCANLPASSCTTPATRFNAGSTRFQTIESYDATGASSYTLTASLGATSDVCFTPLGRAYSRASFTDAFAPLTTPATMTVTRGAGILVRTVAILPNGTARVSAGAL
jgi:prepilin-type N-terminal cleavage/methylation domain-containing protein